MVFNYTAWVLTPLMLLLAGAIIWSWSLKRKVASKTVELMEQLAERKETEEAFRKEKEFSTTVVQSSPAFFVAISGDGKTMMMNESMLQMIGYTQDEVVGKDYLTNFVPEEDRELLSKVFETLVISHEPTLNENRVLTKDGRKLLVEWHGKQIFKLNGDFDYFFGIGTDITVRRFAEEELRRYREHLEELVQERTAELQQFAYIVSHDLRAPLVNLKGFSSELRLAMEVIQSIFSQCSHYLSNEKQKEISTALDEDVPEALGFIDASASRMDSLINLILKLSRIGRRDLNFEQINMNDLVDDLLRTMAHQIEKCRANIKVAPLPEVVADRISMEHIMGNLLDNAVKYLAPDRGGEIEVWGEKKEGFTFFHIRDNGHGIPRIDISRIFEIFRRSGKQDKPGEGMGLAYVQTLVRRHGGQIRCESEEGAGATFTFTIPNHHTEGGRNG